MNRKKNDGNEDDDSKDVASTERAPPRRIWMTSKT